MTRLRPTNRLVVVVLILFALASTGLLAIDRLPSVASGIAEARLRALGFTEVEVPVTHIGFRHMEAGPVRLIATAGVVDIERITADYHLAALAGERRLARLTLHGIHARLAPRGGAKDEGSDEGGTGTVMPIDPRALLTSVPPRQGKLGIAVDRIEVTQARLDAATGIGAVTARLDAVGRLTTDGRLSVWADVTANHADASLAARIDAEDDAMNVAGALDLNGLSIPGAGADWMLDGIVAFSGWAGEESAPTMTVDLDLDARADDQPTVAAKGALAGTVDGQTANLRAARPVAVAATTPDGRRITLDLDNPADTGAALLAIAFDGDAPRIEWSATMTTKADRPRIRLTGDTQGRLNLDASKARGNRTGGNRTGPFLDRARLSLAGLVAPPGTATITDLSFDIDAAGDLDRIAGRAHVAATPPSRIAGLAWRRPQPITVNGRYEWTPGATVAFLDRCVSMSGLSVASAAVTIGLDAPTVCPHADAPLVAARLDGEIGATINARLIAGTGEVRARATNQTIATGALPDIDATTRIAAGGTSWSLAATARGGSLDLAVPPRVVRAEGLDADIIVEKTGPAPAAMRATVAGITITDTQRPRMIVPMIARGRARLGGDGRLRFILNAGDAADRLSLEVEGFHDLGAGYGGATVSMQPLDFARDGLQPTTLFPVLKGAVTAAEGRFELGGSVTWGGDRVLPLLTLSVDGGGLATLAADVRDIKTAVVVTSIAPLQSRYGQELSVGLLDAGVPLVDGAVRFHLSDGGAIVIEHAEWPFAGGRLLIDDQTIHPDRRRQTVAVRVDNIDVAALVALLGRRDVESSGRLSGLIPVVIDSDGATLDDARLTTVEGGGIIRYTPDTPAKAVARQGGGILVDALKNFHYRTLSMGLDGPLTGTVAARVVLQGRNPDLYGGHPIEINLALEGNLADLIAAETQLFGREGVKELIKQGTGGKADRPPQGQERQ